MQRVMRYFLPNSQRNLFNFFLRNSYTRALFETLIIGAGFYMVLSLGSRYSFAQTQNSESGILKVTNSKRIQKELRFNQYRKPTNREAFEMKIAVLDRYFGEIPQAAPHSKIYLPLGESLRGEFINFDKNGESSTSLKHGLAMAKIASTAFGPSELGPNIFLLKVSGHYRSLDEAIDFAIQNKIRIILNSTNHYFGSNFDGSGIYSRIIDKAHAAGIIWINSVGNEQRTVYSQPVLDGQPRNGFIDLPNSNRTLKFRVDPVYNDKKEIQKNPIRVVLSWNDFPTDPINGRANTDLDLSIYDHNKNEFLAVKNNSQIKTEATATRPYFPLAREEGIFLIEPGDYSIQVKDISENFTNDSFLQLIVSSENKGSVYLLQTEFTERVLYPSDSAKVIAVGNFESSFGTTLDGRKKPDLLMPFTDIEISEEGSDQKILTQGSSNAAALFAGVTARLLIEKPNYKFEDILKVIQSQSKTTIEDGVPADRPIWRTPAPDELP
jgi:hypothetical protein